MIDHDYDDVAFWKNKNAQLTKDYEDAFRESAEFIKVLKIRNANFALSEQALTEARERWRLEDAKAGGTVQHH